MLLASLATFGGSIVIPHGDECHDYCVHAVVEHDASAHRFQADTAVHDSHPLHCLVCHSGRSFRPRQHAVLQPGVPDPESSPRPPEFFAIAPASFAAQPPLRSPPIA
jgi:hypothetical protein